MKLFNFENWSVVSKIGHHFRKLIDLKIDVRKKFQKQKCAPKFVLFNDKKLKRFE